MNHDEMSHDELRQLLPLAAANALAKGEAVLIRGHAAQCAACAQELRHWEELLPELAMLPAPAAPAGLAQKTLLRVKQSRQAAEERRWNNRVLALVVAFCWAVSLASWRVAHLATGSGWLAWLIFSTTTSWITAGCAAVILGSHLRGRKYASIS
jgi:anti-sigma factor RsiW